MAFDNYYVPPQDLSAFQLIEPGEGKFKVIKIEEKQSKAGNQMLVVTFRISNMKGQSTLYNEYLVGANTDEQRKTTATKIYNLLVAIGKTDLYGKPIGENIVGVIGTCIIKTQKSEDPQYNDKSVIAQYLSPVVNNAENSNQTYSDMDQEIPF